MRRVRYVVAMSLDGYIAGPNGEYDWIVQDPEIDFGATFAQFDTFFIGRKTYEMMVAAGRGGSSPGTTTYVFSTTLDPADHPDVKVVADDLPGAVDAARAGAGKDIWLFGGGELFRSLLAADLVDTVEVAIVPVLLGDGLRLLPTTSERAALELTGHHVYGSGIVSLQYDVVQR